MKRLILFCPTQHKTYGGIKDYDHARYDVLGSNNMKHMARVLGDVMITEAHEHVFCYALELVL